ncbi:hypothetical protein ACHAWF_016736 [Thalassiosira exigua]
MAKAPLVALLMAAAAALASSADDDSQCGIYLAESSTGHVLGTFAARAYARDDVLGSPDAAIQFVDIRAENAARDISDDDSRRLENFLGTCWSGDATGGIGEGGEVVSAVGGPCFSATGHVGMINAVIYQPSSLLRTDRDLLASGYDESTSPGRGAFTTYHNLTMLAVDKIPPGMEIFLDFGAEYNKHDDPNKPNIDDYRKMDEAMEKMLGFFNKHASKIGEKAAEEVFEFLKKDVLDLTAEKRAPAARSLLPETYRGLQEVIDKGGSALSANPEVVKDMEWLKEHAYCQDALEVGVSRIPHAGRGAFARLSLKKGEVASPVPLVVLNNGRDVLKLVEDSGPDEGAVSKSLLYNYMLEHPKSSVLFFPAGAVSNFVNHGGKEGANVKLIWSTKEWSFNQEAQDQVGVDELSLVGPIELMMELVATRPIEKGEEILLNYGDEWEKAWKEHVANWGETIKGKSFPRSAMVLNDLYKGEGKPPEPFPTVDDDKKEYDEESVAINCMILYDEDKIERRRNQDGTRTKVYPWIPHPVAGASRLRTDEAVRGVNGYPCDVLERSGDAEAGYKYVVRPRNRHDGESMGILVKNVPHHAIRFVDLPYKNAQHEATAFRHAIGFPDDVFPDLWKDLKEDEDAEETTGAKEEL